MKNILVLIVAILFLSCDTAEDKGNFISGKVTYPNGSSGIKVSLYDAYVVNDTLSSIMNQYPNIGTKIDKNILFDFNSQSALQTVYTDGSGNWEMTKLDKGNYNIVYSKNGSYDFDYDLNIGSGENNRTKTLSKAIVWQDTTLSGIVDIPPFSKIFIKGTVTVDEFSMLTIGHGSSVVLADSSVEENIDKGKIKVLDSGSLIFDGSEDAYINVFGAENKNINPKSIWNSVSIGTNGVGKFRYTRFSNGNQAVFYLKSKVDVENCIFLNCDLGLGFEMNVGGDCGKNIFMGCTEGFNGTKIDSFDIKNNIFYANTKGVLLSGIGSFDLFNSYITKSVIGLQVWDFVSGVVRNSEIDENSTGILVYGDNEENGGTKPIITKNNFEKNRILDINISAIPYAKSPNPKIIHNNFLNNDIVNIKIYNWAVFDIVANNNWWTGETDSLTIENRIIDGDDYGEGPKILFMPVSENEIENAGIE